MQELINFSFSKMKALLFPFNFSRWLKILLIVWLAGAAGGGGGGGSNWSNGINKVRNQQQTAKPPVMALPVPNLPSPPASSLPAPDAPASPISPPPMPFIPDSVVAPEPPQSSVSAVNPALQQDEKLQKKNEMAERFKKSWPWLVLGILGIGLPILILSMWLSSRFQFILLNFLTHQDLAIRSAFGHYRELGNSLLAFSWIFIVAMLGGVGLLIVPMLLGPVGIVLSIILILVFLLAVIVTMCAVNDFIVPLMFHQNLKIRDAARLFWNQDFDLGQIFIYYLVKIGIGIVASIALGIVSLVIFLIVGIPAGIGIALAIWMMKSIVALKILSIAIMVIVGVIAIAAILLGLGLISLPVHIFFQCYRVAFVTKLLPSFQFFIPPDTVPTSPLVP